jgi:hydrogenase maturation protease
MGERGPQKPGREMGRMGVEDPSHYLTGVLDPRWDPWGQTAPIDHVPFGDGELRAGDAVRLRPRGGADILDLALAGRTARVQAIERDFDDEVHVAVVLDDDPGRDLGELRQPGHRFFFRLSEIEPLPGVEPR